MDGGVPKVTKAPSFLTRALILTSELIKGILLLIHVPARVVGPRGPERSGPPWTSAPPRIRNAGGVKAGVFCPVMTLTAVALMGPLNELLLGFPVSQDGSESLLYQDVAPEKTCWNWRRRRQNAIKVQSAVRCDKSSCGCQQASDPTRTQ